MFVVHIRILDKVVFPESGLIVTCVCVGYGCGREVLLHAGHLPDAGHGDACVRVQYRRGARDGGLLSL